jgi:endonuclease YncB( thermonuclease family)
MSLIFLCLVASITDGDTFRCSNGQRVRIAGIDAPELAGHCRRGRICTPGNAEQSKRALAALIEGKPLKCQALGRSYNRILATCTYGKIDIGCAQVRSGNAVKRYSESWRVCRTTGGSDGIAKG